MQFDEIEVREVERDGEIVVQIDGYHRPRPESKYPEYRRVVIVDLTEEQATTLHEQLAAYISD